MISRSQMILDKALAIAAEDERTWDDKLPRKRRKTKDKDFIGEKFHKNDVNLNNPQVENVGETATVTGTTPLPQSVTYSETDLENMMVVFHSEDLVASEEVAIHENLQPVETDKGNVNLHELIAFEDVSIQDNLQTENTDNLHEFEEVTIQESVQTENTDDNNANPHEFEEVAIQESFQTENTDNLHEFEEITIQESVQTENTDDNNANPHEFEEVAIQKSFQTENNDNLHEFEVAIQESFQTENTDENNDNLHEFEEVVIQESFQTENTDENDYNLHEFEEVTIQESVQAENTDDNNANLHEFEEVAIQESFQTENNDNLHEFEEVVIQESFQTENTDENNDNLHEFEDVANQENLQTDVSEENNTNKTKISNASTRWRKSDPSSWKINKNKHLKRSGLPYLNKKGEEMPGKQPKAGCINCRFECTKVFTVEERKDLCQQYYSMVSYERQKDFIINLVDEVDVQRKRPRNESESKGKEKSRHYHFMKDGNKKRVCKRFFLGTLCISHGPVDNALLHKNEAGIFYEVDKRGKKEPGNKTKSDKVAEVRKHIESFPVMESHYCRRNSQRRYLDENLSISKMYDLYKNSHDNPVSEITYRRIFCNYYNLSFFKPKKDQCIICINFKNASPEEKAKMMEIYEHHTKMKDAALQSKAADKERAAKEEHFVSASFDLQSVLQIPSGNASQLYYSRKLCAYNLSLYESAEPNRAFCFCWTEINGQRGSSEIGTSLLRYFTTLPDRVREVSLYSDTCSGQNRNKHIASLFLYVVQTFPNIDAIQHNFFEKGHSLMEADSIHSAIESAKKHASIFLMNDWLNIMRIARSKRNKNKSKDPYIVTELTFEDFVDLKTLSKVIMPKNIMLDTNKEKVQWLKIKRIRYEKGKPNTVLFSYDYVSPFSEISLKIGKNKFPKHLEKLYKKQLSISSAKKADLMNLCKKGVIGNEYHAWYAALPSSTKQDRLPEPTLSEDEELI